MKEIKEDTNRWRNIPCSWIRRTNIVKMSIWFRVIYRFNITLIKLPTIFFTELEQTISQFVWKHKKTSNIQINLEKEEWNWRNHPSWLQTIHKSTVIKTLCYWHKDRHIDQWNEIEKPRDKSTHLWTPCDFPGGSDGKASAYKAGDLGSISEARRSPGEGNGNPLHYSCLENPTDGRAL